MFVLGSSMTYADQGLTVSVVLPVIPPDVALMVVWPETVSVVDACAKPVASIVATLVSDEAHVAMLVISCFTPSEVVAIAVYDWV